MRTVDDLLGEKGRDVWTVRPDATVQDAVRVMSERNVGAVVVCDGEHALGIFSERDCVRRVVLEGRSALDTRVLHVMSSPIRSVGLRDSVDHCMQQMTDRRVRHLPVVDHGRIVGMISVGDVVKAELSAQEDV
ncbi:MAG TPA: CBS domain-containing protein, partial [Polyangiaceae bacterium]|nr:CBS domain-containing protein [Polyangiaceae bacterium]